MQPFNYVKQFTDTPKKILIMLHGFGSNKEDLFDLATYLPKDISIFSLNGPLELPQMRNVHARYPLSLTDEESLDADTQELQTGAEYILEFINYLKTEYQLHDTDIYLLGFSQGANMSYYLLSEYPDLFKGILALSGRYPPALLEKSYPPSLLQGKEIFIGHGEFDSVVIPALSEEALEKLEQL